MGWTLRALVWLAAVAGIAALPATASALDSADSISVSAPSGIIASYPFNFSGGGTVDGDTGDSGGYTEWVLWAPDSASNPLSSCPQSYAAAVEAIDFAYGGPGSDASYSAEGVDDDPIGDPGPYTYTADVNDLTVPTLTTPGRYVACAYLTDIYSSTTYAVSPAPISFTVANPPGSGKGKIPGRFGGPGASPNASGLGLRARLTRKLRDPGRNLLDVSGQFAVADGPAFLDVDVKLASRYNGCASNDEEDEQITLADKGVEIANSLQTTPNSAGQFKSPIALNIKRRVPGTYVVCAYLEQDFDDIAVGFDRITVHRHTTHKKPKKRRKRKTHH